MGERQDILQGQLRKCKNRAKDARERNRTADLRISDAFHQDTSATPYHLATRAFDEKESGLGVRCTAGTVRQAGTCALARPRHPACLLNPPQTRNHGIES